MKRAVVIVGAILAIASFFSVAVQLNHIVAVETPTTSVNQQESLEQANQSIEQVKQQRDALVLQLQQIEKQYGYTARSLRELSVQMNGKQQRLKAIQQQIQQYKTKVTEQNQALAQQLKAAFIMGKQEKLHLLLNQQDPALISRMMIYQHYVNQARLKKLATLKNTLTSLSQLEHQKQLENTLLAQIIRSHQLGQYDLARSKSQREQLLSRLNHDFALKSEQLSQLNRSVEEAQALIDRLQQAALPAVPKPENLSPETPAIAEPPTQLLDDDGNLLKPEPTSAASSTPIAEPEPKAFAQLKGQLPWPVKATIVKKFGSPRFESRWDGVLMAAKEGTEIQTVADGQVVFANWLRGYGLLMIIDHGQGYMTLYAFNQSLYKQAGDRVKTGEVIAAVGKSDGREEAGLYFGIRNKGKAVDPMKWCQ